MNGHSARYISTRMTVPATAEMRSPIPSITAAPMPSIPAMKRTSDAGLAIAAKNGLRGPTTESPSRNPWLGVPPLTQARSMGVEKPSPNVLSRNAQRKIQPVASRSTASEARAARLCTRSDSRGMRSARVSATGAASVAAAGRVAVLIMILCSANGIAAEDQSSQLDCSTR